jgi:hypothetical protein
MHVQHHQAVYIYFIVYFLDINDNGKSLNKGNGQKAWILGVK